MRALKLAINAFILFVLLPVSIVAVMGIMLSPLQTSARALEPRTAFEVSDIMWEAEAEREVETVPEAETAPGTEVESVVETAPEAEAMSEVEVETQVEAELEVETTPEMGAAPEAEAVPETETALAIEAVPKTEIAEAELEAETLPELELNPTHALAQDLYSSDQFRTQGVIYDDNFRYTWYSQRVLPGGGLEIPGRHVSVEGYVVDGQERIVVASSDLPCGTELAVPFGSGRAVVLDTGCASGTIDVYTDF